MQAVSLQLCRKASEKVCIPGQLATAVEGRIT